MFEKFTLAFGSLLLAAMPLAAEQLTPGQALDRALGSSEAASQQRRLPALQSASQLKLVYTAGNDGMNTLYVFDGAGKGFMIVAADDAVDTPLLGYSESGSFDPENIPANMAWFLEGYSRKVAAVASGEESTYSAAAPGRRDIAPICRTKWDQISPYNDMCPEKDGQHAYTGCAATAMAQIMKAHNWPVSGEGSNRYTPTGYPAQEVDFSESVYDWANMTNTYDSKSTAQQKEAVAKLMYDCGVAQNMVYSNEGSGALSTAAPTAFINYFRYSRGLRPYFRESFHYDEFVGMIYDELIAGRPVLVTGSNYTNGQNMGHAFIVDGYHADGDYFHLNWGWSGMSDGYYLISALDPAMQGSGGSASGYNMGSLAVMGITPDRDGNSPEGVPYIFSNTDFKTARNQYTHNGSVVFFSGGSGQGVFNYTPFQVSVRPGVKLVNEATGEESTIYGTSFNMPYARGITSFSVSAASFPTDGNYIVTPGFLFEDKWYDIRVAINRNQKLRLEASNTELNFEYVDAIPSASVANISKPETAYFSTPFRITADLTPNGGEFYDIVQLTLLNQRGQTLAVLDRRQIDLLEGETKTIEWVTAIAGPSTGFTAGTYNLVIGTVASSGAISPLPGGTFEITFAEKPLSSAPTATVELIGASGTGSVSIRPAEMAIDNFAANLDISLSKGYFADYMTLAFFNRSGSTYLGQAPEQFIELKGGESAKLSYKADLSGILSPSTVYLMGAWGAITGQVGTDVRYVRFTPSGIEEVAIDEDDTTVYPNVVADNFTVSAPAPIMSVAVYALSGARVMSVAGGNADSLTVDAGALAPGHYIASIVLADGTVVNRQIIKK